MEPPTSPALVMANLQVHYQRAGWLVVAAQPAREANLAQWRRLCTRGVNPDGTQTAYDLATPAAEAWLLFVEALPNGHY